MRLTKARRIHSVRIESICYAFYVTDQESNLLAERIYYNPTPSDYIRGQGPPIGIHSISFPSSAFQCVARSDNPCNQAYEYIDPSSNWTYGIPRAQTSINSMSCVLPSNSSYPSSCQVLPELILPTAITWQVRAFHYRSIMFQMGIFFNFGDNAKRQPGEKISFGKFDCIADQLPLQCQGRARRQSSSCYNLGQMLGSAQYFSSFNVKQGIFSN